MTANKKAEPVLSSANSMVFALVFRLGALIFAIAGVLAQIGAFGGNVSTASFMYYTLQSNVLAIFLFALLTVRTAREMGLGALIFTSGPIKRAAREVKNLRVETRGFTGFYARFEMVCMVDIMLTFIVFWTLLSSQVSAQYLWTFENLAVHTITPLLCVADYYLFTKGGHLKYRDIYYIAIYPLSYVAFSAIAGLAGYVYSFRSVFDSPFSSTITWEPVRAPYFFLDYWSIGGWVAAYVAGILVFFVLLGHGVYFLDKKRAKK